MRRIVGACLARDDVRSVSVGRQRWRLAVVTPPQWPIARA